MHTGGEPTRIVVEGWPESPRTLLWARGARGCASSLIICDAR